jgi:hypothetical protein
VAATVLDRKYLGRRLAVMSQQIADTGPFRGRPRAAPVDSTTKCCLTGRVTEDAVAAQKRRLRRLARYHWPLGMALNVCLIWSAWAIGRHRLTTST